MNIYVLGRSLPIYKNTNIGIFEYGQARLLSNDLKVTYLFCDNQSIKIHRKVKQYYKHQDNLLVSGIYFPIGGIYKPLYEEIKYLCFKQVFDKAMNTDNNYPDIIHVHFPLLTLNKKIIDYIKSKNVKIVVTEHWSKILEKKLTAYEVKKLNIIMKNVNSFKVVSSTLKSSVEFYRSNDNLTVEVIPNFVPNIFLEKDTKNIDNDEKFNLAFIGRFSKNKNIKFLIESMPQLIKKIPNVQLNIYGGGVEDNALKRVVNELNLDSYVKFHGYVSNDEVPNKLQNNDVYVSASLFETFGVPYIEAMALGIPVISPKNGPIDDVIRANEGILFINNDIDSYNSAVLAMYNKYKNIDKIKIKKNIENMFSEETIKKNLLSIYNSI